MIKEKIEKIYGAIFGSSKNISFVMSLAALVTGIILLIFSFIYVDNTTIAEFLSLPSALFFSVWIILSQGVESLDKIGYGMLRIMFFIYGFMWTISTLLHLNEFNETNLFFRVILSSIILFACVTYFIYKLNDIYEFMKKAFLYIKLKIFNTTVPATTKIKAVIENITVFLVTIGGFGIAIKTILEVILQIVQLLK